MGTYLYALAALACIVWGLPDARGASTVVRTITNNSTPSPDVSLAASPAATVSVYAVEETLPAGLTPANISNDGSWDSANRKVKWGPFFDHTARTLTYEVTGPDGAYALAGVGSFDGSSATTTGDLQAIILSAPEIAVTGDPDFGSVEVSAGSADRTFTVQNRGTAVLSLTGAPRVAILGANAADFAVLAEPAATVAPGGSTTFTVRFDPSAAGLRQATVSIGSNDGSENPYTLAVHGLGAVPTEPGGDFDLVFADPGNAGPWRLWDFSGHYLTTGAGYTLTLDLVQDEKGTLGGVGRIQGTLGGVAIDVGGMPISGKVKGKAGVVTLKATIAGAAGSAGGKTAVSLKLSATLDGGHLVGTVTGMVVDTAGGKQDFQAPLGLALPPGMDGTYHLPVELLLDAKGGIGGDGILVLSNGRTVVLVVKGRRQPDGTALLGLAGDAAVDPAFKAVRVRLSVRTLSDGRGIILGISGKALGQSLKWPL